VTSDEKRTGELTHLDSDGRPRMVDVSDKTVTTRLARAEGWIHTAPGTIERLVKGGPKGDALRVAELAGIQAAKRTAELIPLCHLLAGVSVGVHGTTGVELEALTAVSVALLTLYDMGKAVDRGMVIGGIRLTEKSGGRSGVWKASDSGEAAG